MIHFKECSGTTFPGFFVSACPYLTLQHVPQTTCMLLLMQLTR